ncbi:hypothetical protein NLX67_10840 [Domibacillus sp. A3M-37]|uniref:hypothetical protein n=1 Tax=Domibacillus sp. A3M-37 TaxID=2962037 RepID=UPI0020B6BB29|nr:hypothetical protein [Domibacillus sp. A3M-37]MCP3762885.1 hypothetical protein [Domibacillus sp. A3M-37]
MKKSYLDFSAESGIGGTHPGGFSLTKEIFLSRLDLPIGASIPNSSNDIERFDYVCTRLSKRNVAYSFR